jgi:hypothetical protein
MTLNGVDVNLRWLAKDFYSKYLDDPVYVTKQILEWGLEVALAIVELIVFAAKTRFDIARLVTKK